MTEKPLMQVGKNGISDNTIKNLNDLFNAHELVKISVMKSAADSIKEFALDLAKLSRSEVVQVVGRQIILYRRSKEPQIILP